MGSERSLLRETIGVLCLGLVPFLLAAGVLILGLWWQVSSHAPFFSFTPGSSALLPFETSRGASVALTLLAVAFWIGMYAVIRRTREVIVQYVGDVAAYISPFAVSKFAEIRSAIQAVGLRVACAVYRARTGPASAAAHPSTGGKATLPAPRAVL